MIAPCSWYSCRLIHICWKEPRELRMEPPTHAEVLMSAALKTLTLKFCGAISGICLCRRASSPLSDPLPPAMITFVNRSLLMSISVLPTDSVTMHWRPVKPSEAKFCMKRLSVNCVRSLPIVSWVPSGNSKSLDLVYWFKLAVIGSSETYSNWVFRSSII